MVPRQMQCEVVYTTKAQADISETSAYILEKFGPDAAAAYLHEITYFCDLLADFPRKGRKRDDIAQGLCTISFNRRAVIGFAIRGRHIVILRIWSKGRRIKP